MNSYEEKRQVGSASYDDGVVDFESPFKIKTSGAQEKKKSTNEKGVGVYHTYDNNLDDDYFETEDDYEDEDLESDDTDDLAYDEEVSTEDPEFIKRKRKEMPTITVEGDHIYYHTKDVAKLLHLKPQDIRNICKDFSEFLDIETLPSGHRRYTLSDVNKIRSILELKSNNRYTTEQTKAALATEEGQIMIAHDEPERLKKLMEWTLEQMQLIVEEKVSEAISKQTEFLLESKEEKTLLIEENEKKQQTIDELNNKLDALTTKMEKLLKDNGDKDEKLERLMEKNEEILRETQKKKRGLFFRK